VTHHAGVFSGAAYCLAISDPLDKCAAVQRLWQQERDDNLLLDVTTAIEPITQPGRPARPELVEPSRVPRRRLGSTEGRAALVHAVAHIEFNAINLALDAVYRFRDLPRAYYRDWLSVACDEARHFSLLTGRLEQLGYTYGDFPAHNGLWEMAEKTSESCLMRMALVPRVLEARGLDVTPGLIARLGQVGDENTMSILEVILAEEVRHVELGTRWYRYCCTQQGLNPDETFVQLIEKGFGGSMRGPFNLPAREKAGFSQWEMEVISGSAHGKPDRQ